MKILLSFAAIVLLTGCTLSSRYLPAEMSLGSQEDGQGTIISTSAIGKLPEGIGDPHDFWVARASERILRVARAACQTQSETSGSGQKDCFFEVSIVDDNRGTASFRAGRIKLTRTFLKKLQHEAEVAFVLAHEAAHGILLHRLNVNSRARQRQEFEADALGQRLVGLAGYPTSVVEALLERLAQRMDSTTSADLNYPTFAQRATALSKSSRQIVQRPR